MIEETEERIKEIQNCDIEECPYDMSEEEHTQDHMAMVARKQALKEVKRDFMVIDQ